jgi:hypothetical protein
MDNMIEILSIVNLVLHLVALLWDLCWEDHIPTDNRMLVKPLTAATNVSQVAHQL